MNIVIAPEKIRFHREVTDQYRRGQVTHEDRVAQLKAFGITAWENIELDCRYQDEEMESDE